MNNLESENVIVAIGVLSVCADAAYDVKADKQTEEWNAYRTAIYFLSSKIERIAKQEVTNERN